ncbi:CDP-alcohol phosphatidyltransferase family protein [Desulfovibrio sp. JC022]|uniref:CDP-alcohol phosphatidyltransferase family protein n=1 Tax=Desulfovibrio sp. JC022 TaxID=2593642 RepID=UPI0013D1B5EE|nr:CDP-alcohol phosphatidyltransferase family protein [Desulfovibrio sp. JC022]NDV23808.1 hypothetical protein [Desulfovibrio sp. JC022]
MSIKLSSKNWFVIVQSITILRVVLAFVFVVLVPLPELVWTKAVIYFLALSTDFWDGRLARAKKVASQFGGAMDIFGDRYLMVISCLYAGFKGIPLYILAVILIREIFSVTMKMITYEGKQIIISNTKIGGLVHLTVGLGVLLIILNPENPVTMLTTTPFAIVATFYCFYFPFTLYKSRHMIKKAINFAPKKP